MPAAGSTAMSWGWRERIALLLCATAGLAAAFSLSEAVDEANAVDCFPWEYCREARDVVIINNVITIRWGPSKQLGTAWQGKPCSGNFDGDGDRGDHVDRAMCVLGIIRFFGCPSYGWGPKTMICYAATDKFNEWRDIRRAMIDADNSDCLAVQVGSTVSPPYNWTYRDLWTRECDF
jgi:hypothetical protein